MVKDLAYSDRSGNLKHLGAASGLRVGSGLTSLIADEQLHGVIDHFVRLLEFTPSELQRCGTDTDGHLVPRLRAVTTPMAIFIDGVDEYFNKHVEGPTSHPSVTGELSPNIWHFAQLGLVEVTYQVRRINHHIKIFAAVRKEAYARLAKTTVMAQQYRGSAVDIAYSPRSLREIFLNNVRLLKSEAMVRPEKLRSDPLEAFLGRTTVTDAYTREEEGGFEFICRHTLLRPRDLMTIGEHLTALRPSERQSELRFKEVVHQAATEIAYEYLAEIAPYIGNLELEQLLRRLSSNVLSREQMEVLFLEHSVATGGEEKHVFCALYRVGLLGYVHYDRARGEWAQRFLRPGEATLEPDGMLPLATHYLLHPVLHDVIGRLNPAYPQQVHRANIVGYDRPWLESESAVSPTSVHTFCVLKGDVYGFGRLMHARADARSPRSIGRCRSPVGSRGGGRGDRVRGFRVGRARGSGGSGPGRPPYHGRRVPSHRSASPAHSPALRRGADAGGRRRCTADDRGGRCCAMRGPGRAPCATGTNLGDGRVPRATHAKAVVMAHDRGNGAGRRRSLQCQESRTSRAGSVGPPLSS